MLIKKFKMCLTKFMYLRQSFIRLAINLLIYEAFIVFYLGKHTKIYAFIYFFKMSLLLWLLNLTVCPYIFQLIQMPGIKIFRFDCNLYFANAEQFRDRLYERTGLNPKKLKTKKQKALYKALLQRKREIELAEIEEAAALKKEKVIVVLPPFFVVKGKSKWLIN